MNKRIAKTLVPKLRFPEFRDAGEWSEKPLEEVAIFSKGKGVSKSDISQNGALPCIRYGELYTYYGETIDSIISYTDVPSDDLVLSKANDIIIPASGETQEDIATASCVLNSGIALGGDLNIIRTQINGVFLSYYLNNAKRKDIAQLAQGIAVVHLYSGQLKKLNVNIPEPLEQQKIADCLSSIDDLITAQAQKLDTLKAHKKGLMQQLFPAQGETVPKLRFPEFRGAGEWPDRSLGKLGKTISGLSGKSGDAFGSGKPYVTYKQIFDCARVDLAKCKRVEIADNERQNKLKRGDVLFTTSSETPDEIGFASVLLDSPPEPVYLNSFCFSFRPDNLYVLKPEFSRYLFHSPIYRNSIRVLAQGITRFNISKGAFLKLNLPIPNDGKEQQKIANCLSSIDDLITAQAQKLDTLKAHKKGLMQQLFPSVDEVGK